MRTTTKKWDETTAWEAVERRCLRAYRQWHAPNKVSQKKRRLRLRRGGR